MKKGEIVELIYLKLVGGKLSDDVNIQRDEIEVYLPGAINWAVVNKTRQDRLDNRREGFINDNVSPDLKYTYKVEEIKEDTDRALKYVLLPVPIQTLDSNQGLVSAFPAEGERGFRKFNGPRHFDYLGDAMKSITYFWLEKINGEERVYFKNLSPSVEYLYLELVPSIPDLGDDDTLPIPAGMEVEVIDICVKYFQDQVFGPADYIADNKDDKHQ